MKQKKIELLLFSAVGVLLMFFIIVAVNVISGAVNVRKDMTEHKLYTLAEGTRKILQNLDAPVEIRYYRSESGGRVPSSWRTYMGTVSDLLEEMKEAAKGKIDIKKYDPEPDSDEEDLANLDGIQGQLNPATGENFYLGLAVSLDPVKVALPVLPPNRAELLEYDIARAISQVVQTNKPVVGVMTPLPIFGMPSNPMMARMGQQGQRPWVFLSELKRDFDVRQIQMDTDKIEDDVNVLMVIHPKEITDKAQFAIDQFILRGGKLVALLDAKSIVDRPQDGNPMSAMMGGGASNLEKLLKAWGITFETTQVVADLDFSREVSFQQGAPPQKAPSLLFLNKDAVDVQDVATSQIDDLLLPMAGTFSGTPVAGLTQTVLIHSSKRSQLVDPMTSQFNGQKIIDDFKPSDKEYPLAIRLQGKFKTAFPEGKPEATAAAEEGENKPKPAGEFLKESKKESVVVLLSDSDFIYDNFAVRILPIFNVAQPINGNLTLVQNLVEQMAGDINLIGSRSRASINRPFTVVRKLEAEANQRFQDEIKKLEEEKAEAERVLGELQSKKEGSQQQFILSPEQQAEIEKFRQKQVQANKKLKEVRKSLRKDIDSLEFWTKVYNIAGMPLLVVIAGISIAVVRKQRTRAR